MHHLLEFNIHSLIRLLMMGRDNLPKQLGIIIHRWLFTSNRSFFLCIGTIIQPHHISRNTDFLYTVLNKCRIGSFRSSLSVFKASLGTSSMYIALPFFRFFISF